MLARSQRSQLGPPCTILHVERPLRGAPAMLRMTRWLAASAFLLGCGGQTQAPVGSTPDSGHRPDAGPGTRVPDGSCRTTADCDESQFQGCFGPSGCQGGCESLPSCTEDSQCDAGTVCQGPMQGSCVMEGDLNCAPPCTSDGDCALPTQQCSGGHCAPIPCDQCPPYLSCTNGACAAKACTSDADCPGGYCVNATCMGTLGTCSGECG